MKRTLFIIVATIISNVIVAQGALDALTYSQIRYEGTARSMAMGNAFTSLGGDTYAISINPAASGIYRYSEFAVTPAITHDKSSTLYIGNRENEGWTKFGISNLGFVGHIPVSDRPYGLKSISFGVAVNKLNNFSSRSVTSGVNAQSSWLGSLAESLGGIHNASLDITDNWNPFYDFRSAPWKAILAWNSNLLDPLPDSDEDYIGATENIRGLQIVMGGPVNQEFFRERSGNMSEIAFNASANISDRFFIGANVGVQTLSFYDYQRYSESAVNNGDFDSRFESFSYAYRLNTNGAGINLKVGFIALPFDGLRIGASIATPTWSFMTDEWDEKINAKYSDGYKSQVLSPYGEYSYRINSPMRYNLGASYIIGSVGILSVDYEGVDYSTIKMMTESGDPFEFREDNKYIKDNFQSTSILRAGAEIRASEAFAIRGGYTKYGNPEKSFGSDVQYVSAGLGYRSGKGTFIDVAFQKRLNTNESYSLYEDYTNHAAPVATLESSGWKVLMTLGFRF
ncbi:MAG: hypothetical protein A2X19_02985 [Bacteroidetes bacterium GWE2_39_28]|nr:MAG: hypothetical protein A2X19_02985 [Bacteroidetes bacterium GWE2_39_28]OFY16052.1 MAG: hypothetical protein A2X16_10150 [Bacteroidetes bacterium GWF2_39_10]OFZ10078.1 MAG: hypothetical protein A2465_11250 [Bacteroidetes bacterium RIFOXYC2_FULL_39_11]HCT94412.1 hypothetical protein [Rikenellaceae bacterium]